MSPPLALGPLLGGWIQLHCALPYLVENHNSQSLYTNSTPNFVQKGKSLPGKCLGRFVKDCRMLWQTVWYSHSCHSGSCHGVAGH